MAAEEDDYFDDEYFDDEYKGSAADRMVDLLVELHRRAEEGEPLPPLPVIPHEERLPSGERGLSVAALEGIRRFYERQSVLQKTMGDVCKEVGFGASVCRLTRRTGLSLAETIALESGGDTELVGPATSFFSYSWTGTRLDEMLGAITRLTGRLEVDGADVARYVWVDMFAASQNLLAGVFRDEAVTKASDPAGYLARKEDTDRLFDGALEAVGEIFFYASPLLDEWDAPNHPWLSPEQKGSPPSRSKGPAAITRA